MDFSSVNKSIVQSKSLSFQKGKISDQNPASFQPLSASDPKVLNQTLANYNRPILNQDKLKHALVEVINHPSIGKIQHYKIFDPTKQLLNFSQDVYIVENHAQEIVTFATNFNVGSKMESASNNGISHNLEHLFFKGNKEDNGSINYIVKTQLANLGARINAHTSFENTYYDIIVPSENFAKAFKIHANMLQNPAIPEDEMKKEKKVVVEEINRSENDPFEKALDDINSILFTAKNYQKNILGPRENIMNFNRDDFLSYFKDHYSPNNRQIIIVGDINPEEALKEVKNNFFKNLNFPPEEKMDDIHDFFEKVNFVNGAVPKTITNYEDSLPADLSFNLLGFHGPKTANKKESAALEILISILNKKLDDDVNKPLPASQKAMKTGIEGLQFKDFSNIILFGVNRPENIKVTQESLIRVIKQYLRTGISLDDLDKAKGRVELSLLRLSQDPYETVGYMSNILSRGTLSEDVNYYNEIKKLTPSDLYNVLVKYLNPENAYNLTILPKNSDVSPNNSSVKKFNLSANPSNNISFGRSHINDDQSAKLSNGIDLHVRTKKDQPLTSITILVDGGNRTDVKAGEAKLLATMLKNSGTTSMDKKALEAMSEKLGIDFKVESQGENLIIKAEAPSKNKEALLKTVSEIITAPGIFAKNPYLSAEVEKEFVKQKINTKNSLTMGLKSPYSVAVDNIINYLYPENHPFGLSMSRMLKKIDSINLNDIRGSYYRTFDPDRIKISMVGDINVAEAKNLLDKSLSNLTGTKINLPLMNSVPIKENIVLATSKPNIKQAEIIKVWRTPGLNDEDTPAIKVLMAVLGLSNDSRLFQEFREKREGLCYTVESYNVCNINEGLINLYVGTSPENINSCLDLFNKEIQKIMNIPVSQEELDKAKSLIKTEYELADSNSQSISHKIAIQKTYHTRTIEENLQKIANVTASDLQRVAKKYFSTPSITSIVAPEENLANLKLDYTR